MLRLLYYLFLFYLIYRALRYFYRMFVGQKTLNNQTKRDSREIIDIEYEELKDDKKSTEPK